MKAGGNEILQRTERNTLTTSYLTIQLILFCLKHKEVKVAVCIDVEHLSERKHGQCVNPEAGNPH